MQDVCENTCARMRFSTTDLKESLLYGTFKHQPQGKGRRERFVGWFIHTEGSHLKCVHNEAVSRRAEPECTYIREVERSCKQRVNRLCVIQQRLRTNNLLYYSIIGAAESDVQH
jgi:hypothetical protein